MQDGEILAWVAVFARFFWVVPNYLKSLFNLFDRKLRINDTIKPSNLLIAFQRILRSRPSNEIDWSINHNEVNPNRSDKGGHHVEKDKDELPISDEEIGADVAAHSETIE